jgi:signal transduction histidine kinase
MNIQARTYIYIATIIMAAATTAIASAILWPIFENTTTHPALAAVVFIIATIAGRFPVKLSQQAQASLIIVPLFMALLLLHPAQAIAIAALSTIVSEILIKAPARAAAFNTAVNSLATGLGGIVFFALKPDGVLTLSAGSLLASGASGFTLLITNLVLVDAMVTLRKGMAYWKQWREAFTFESLQEGGLLPVGLIAALLASQAWWAPLIVMIPAVLAYYGFHHTVSEAASKAELANQLQNKIKELTELQAQLIHSAKMASIGSLATGIAHEINNPVFAISGRAELLISAKDKHLSSAKAEEYIENIRQMAERIADITKHLVEYAQPTGEQKELMLNEVMESSISLMRKKLSGVRLVREYEGIALVNGVDAQLQQVFVNLLSNAVNASAEWGCVTVGCGMRDGEAYAFVKDEGVGMTSGEKEHLFEPFVSKKDVDNRVGMGLGMYTCHRVVESHDGRIDVESEPGKGTTITVRLPSAFIFDPDLDAIDDESAFENVAG